MKSLSGNGWLTFLLAASCGLIVANLYYAQPLVGLISSSTGISGAGAGFIVTLTQVGYGLGLLFIVPLSDLIETKKLTITMLLLLLAALSAFAFAKNSATVFAASLLVGVGAVATQILVPFAASLADERNKGKAVGTVMSGLLLGIMFSRPAASFVTEVFGWHGIFILSAVLVTLLIIVLAKALPNQKKVPSDICYGQLIKSLGNIFMNTPALRRRAFYQAFLFAAFSIFWTVVPMYLTDHFNMSQTGIALFALAGVAGAAAAPIAGKLADRGHTRILTGGAMVLAALSFLLSIALADASKTALALLVISAVTIDMSVSGNLVLGQRVIYTISGAARGRLNGIFMSIFFMGGALGSAIGGAAYARGGWHTAAYIGFAISAVIFVYYLGEYRKHAHCPQAA